MYCSTWTVCYIEIFDQTESMASVAWYLVIVVPCSNVWDGRHLTNFRWSTTMITRNGWWHCFNDLAAKWSTWLALFSIAGGERRICPRNSHQAPDVVILAGPSLEGLQSIAAARHLSNHTVSTDHAHFIALFKGEGLFMSSIWKQICFPFNKIAHLKYYAIMRDLRWLKNIQIAWWFWKYHYQHVY